MKRNDFILIVAILVIAGATFLLYNKIGKEDAGFVKVTVAGELYGTYSLDKNQDIAINDTNRLVIRDGEADMIKADCPDRICVDQKAISKDKESIICLPNQVVVEIIGGEDSQLDAVTN